MSNARIKDTKVPLSCAQYESFLSAYIYARNSKPKKDGSISSSWYLRINMLERKQIEESLKIQNKNEQTKQKAILEGTARLDVLGARYDAGLEKKEKTIIDYGEEYLLDGYKALLANEKLIESGYEPTHRNKLATALWTRHYYTTQETYFHKLVKPFFIRKKYNKPITRVTQKDIYDWDVWRKTNSGRDKPYAPSSIQKHNTLIRMIFKWAQLEGEKFAPPSLPEEPKELAARRRPEVDDDTFAAMYDYLRQRNGMLGGEVDLNSSDIRTRNTLYLLYCYLETLEHFGCRGGLGSNPIKMKDIERIELDGKPQYFLHRKEKGHTYTAAGFRYFDKTFNRLNRFYAARGMEKREYLFEHYENYGQNYSKGDPIRAFRKSWNTMVKHLGINEGVTESHNRITLYSIRHRAIGRAIMQPNANIIDVCKGFGTSLVMAESIYLHYSIKKNYEKLVETDISRYETCDIYSPANGMVIKQIKADTKEHFKLWKENSDLVEFAPNETRERWS